MRGRCERTAKSTASWSRIRANLLGSRRVCVCVCALARCCALGAATGLPRVCNAPNGRAIAFRARSGGVGARPCALVAVAAMVVCARVSGVARGGVRWWWWCFAVGKVCW